MIGNVMVVCVGNICRSPMAEVLLREALRGRGDVTVESAGLGALVDHPAAGHAVELMRELGHDIAAHRARQLGPEMIRKADLILVMESAHRKYIDVLDPTARGKVHRLGEWQDRDIDDPYQQPKAAFADALADIKAGVADWVERIAT